MKQIESDTDKGLIFKTCNLDVDSELLKSAQKKNKDLKYLKAAYNGVVYLKKGKYILRISDGMQKLRVRLSLNKN